MKKLQGIFNYRPPFDEPLLLTKKDPINLIKVLREYEGKPIRITIEELSS